MKILAVLAILSIFASAAFASDSHRSTNESVNKSSNKIKSITESNLRFISSEQKKSPDGIYVPGEFPSQVYSSALTVLAGVGSPVGSDEEPSAFTTSSVVNQLAVIFQDHPEFTQIPKMITFAIPILDRYREDTLYNFYPGRDWNGVRVHQAAAMMLSPAWKGFTNIPQDADTTSVTYTALYFNQLLKKRSFALPSAVKTSFERFRDTDRAAYSYNSAQGLVGTGAFMTWQYDENDPAMPRYYFADPDAGTRIPFNTNDVDCIVNLNVLRLYALTKTSATEGRNKACGLLAYQMLNDKYEKCGIYYPNTYNFAYTAAMVDRAGETCLRPYGDKLVNFVVRTQSADGGWYNEGNAEVNDRVQSTAFAINALAQFGSKSDARVAQAIAKGQAFLISQLRRSASGDLYWKGETFFTATAVARSLVDWKSDAFTTATAMGALLK